jgi:hypothetical protein
MYIISPVVTHGLINGLVLPSVEHFQLNFHGVLNLRGLIAAESKYMYVTASGI